jgi:hypothetical protein
MNPWREVIALNFGLGKCHLSPLEQGSWEGDTSICTGAVHCLSEVACNTPACYGSVSGQLGTSFCE